MLSRDCDHGTEEHEGVSSPTPRIEAGATPGERAAGHTRGGCTAEIWHHVRASEMPQFIWCASMICVLNLIKNHRRSVCPSRHFRCPNEAWVRLRLCNTDTYLAFQRGLPSERAAGGHVQGAWMGDQVGPTRTHAPDSNPAPPSGHLARPRAQTAGAPAGRWATAFYGPADTRQLALAVPSRDN